MIKISSKTGKIFTIEQTKVRISVLINDMLECNDDTEEEIPIPFEDELIKKMIEFFELHYLEALPLTIHSGIPSLTNGEAIRSDNIADYVSARYVEYTNMDFDGIFKLLKLADFMHIDPLIELCSLKAATTLKNKTVEELREQFAIKDVPMEEERLEFGEAAEWNVPA